MSEPSQSEQIGQMLSEDAIRDRAYHLWEADGRPEGNGEIYWHRAQEEAKAAMVAAQAHGVAEAQAKAAPEAAADKPAKAAKPRAPKTPKVPKADKPAKLRAKIDDVAKSMKKAAPKPRAAVPGVKSK